MAVIETQRLLLRELTLEETQRELANLSSG